MQVDLDPAPALMDWRNRPIEKQALMFLVMEAQMLKRLNDYIQYWLYQRSKEYIDWDF